MTANVDQKLIKKQNLSMNNEATEEIKGRTEQNPKMISVSIDNALADLFFS